MTTPEMLKPGESAGVPNIGEAAYFRLQPEGHWMWQGYSLDKILNGLNSQLNNGNIDEFLRLNKLSADGITSYWQAITEFFIRAKTQGYLTPQETGVVGRPLFHYPYQDRDGKVDLYCAILDPPARRDLPPMPAVIQFLRQVITAGGVREDKVRIDTLAKEESQICNPGTWFSMYMEQICTIPPDRYHFFVEIDNHGGGLLQSISRVSGLENEPLTGIDVHDFGKPSVKVSQRGSKEGEHLIPRAQFSRHFPLST